jgi:hypothetical protein
MSTLELVRTAIGFGNPPLRRFFLVRVASVNPGRTAQWIPRGMKNSREYEAL